MLDFWPDKSRERVTTVAERRGVGTGPDPVVLRERAEQAARQREGEERAAAEAADREQRRADIRRRVEEQVGALGVTLELGETTLSFVVRPTLDHEARERLAVALQGVVSAALSWQRARAVAVSYPELEQFAYEERGWAGELARVVAALQAERLVEVVEH